MMDADFSLPSSPAQRQDLALTSSWLNASGMLGFAPPQEWRWGRKAGAFITNPLSLAPRTPAENRQALLYPGGCLLHSGLPNPGFRKVIKENTQRWARSELPIWVHLIGIPDEISRMVRALESIEGVAALELGIPGQTNPEQAAALIQAALGELPLVVNLPLNLAWAPWVFALPRMGISAISLGAPRGRLPTPDGRLVSGRLYSPSLFPLTLQAVRDLKSLSFPIIAGCGVFTEECGDILLQAGAAAVQVDTALWC